MKVRATNKYKELNIKDNELGRIPAKGEEFEVSEERYEVLTKTNKFNTIFVEKVEKIKEKETVVKKTTRKKK